VPDTYQAGKDDWWRYLVLLNGIPVDRPRWASAPAGEVHSVRTNARGMVRIADDVELPLRTEYGRVEIVERAEWRRIAAVYADGGVIRQNPSPYGGTWAFCFTNSFGYRLKTGSGLLRPEKLGQEEVSNNTSEFAAVTYALRALPDGWSGLIHTDSKVTINRFWGDGTEAGLPRGWFKAARKSLTRLGELTPVLLGGHPNRAELAAGVRKDGLPVSEHNVWCDEECGRLGREHWEQREREAAAAEQVREMRARALEVIAINTTLTARGAA
jgi:ribonuclease HI